MAVAKIGVSDVVISAVIVRADGTRENMGIISKKKQSGFSKILNKLIGGNK